MKKRLALAACLIPFAVASTAYSQGPSGRSGSDAAGIEAQAGSTNPSGLAGSTGIKPDKPTDASSPNPSTEAKSTRTAPATKDGDAANRAASGDSTRHSSKPQPATPGDAGKPSKSQLPNSPR